MPGDERGDCQGGREKTAERREIEREREREREREQGSKEKTRKGKEDLYSTVTKGKWGKKRIFPAFEVFEVAEVDFDSYAMFRPRFACAILQ